MMAARSSVAMYVTCEVRVIHERNYANCIIPGCDDGLSGRNFGRTGCPYFFLPRLRTKRRVREKFKEEENVRKAQRGPR
jgi:hypothetical protein